MGGKRSAEPEPASPGAQSFYGIVAHPNANGAIVPVDTPDVAAAKAAQGKGKRSAEPEPAKYGHGSGGYSSRSSYSTPSYNCETVYETVYEKQCETKYVTEYHKECNTVYEEKCETKY